MITQLTALNNTTVIPAKLQHSREGQNLEKNNPELFVKKAYNQSRPDMLIVPDDLQDITAKKIRFLVALKRSIGEQKIDVVIDRGQHRPIDHIAKQQGVLLCR